MFHLLHFFTNLPRISIRLDFDLSNILNRSLDIVAVPLSSLDSSLTLGTKLVTDLPLILLQPLFHSVVLNNMTAIVQNNVSGVFTFGAKKYIQQFVSVANKTFRWTRISAKTNARVSTFQSFVARLGAGGYVADVAAELGAPLMGALAQTRLFAGSAHFTAGLTAHAVLAFVRANPLARSARLSAGKIAGMVADQQSSTILGTSLVHAALPALAAASRTQMAAFQHLSARFLAIFHQQLCIDVRPCHVAFHRRHDVAALGDYTGTIHQDGANGGTRFLAFLGATVSAG